MVNNIVSSSKKNSEMESSSKFYRIVIRSGDDFVLRDESINKKNEATTKKC